MTNIEKLRLFIEHAPKAMASLPPRDTFNSEAIGIRGEDFAICYECWSRVIRRGCSIPKPNQILWSDTDEVPNCDLKEFH